MSSKTNIVLSVLLVFVTALLGYLKNQLDKTEKNLTETTQLVELSKFKADSLSVIYNNLLQDLSDFSQYKDTLVETLQVVTTDTLIQYKIQKTTKPSFSSSINRFGTEEVVPNLKDSIAFRKFLEAKKSTWGHIAFSDSSNKYVSVNVLVGYPYGVKTISYTTKLQKQNPFNQYIGFGFIEERPAISVDVLYKRIGAQLIVGTDGNNKTKISYFIKYKY